METNKHRTGLGRDFLLLWQGYAFSAAGNLLYSIAIGIWVYDSTGSAALMGILSAISYLVSFFLQPFAGVLADFFSKRLLIVAADGLRGILMLLLGTAALAGHLTVWEVLTVAWVAALCNVCFVPAAFSALSLLVPGRELMRAQSLIQGSTSVIRTIGNAASGALVLWCSGALAGGTADDPPQRSLFSPLRPVRAFHPDSPWADGCLRRSPGHPGRVAPGVPVSGASARCDNRHSGRCGGQSVLRRFFQRGVCLVPGQRNVPAPVRAFSGG